MQLRNRTWFGSTVSTHDVTPRVDSNGGGSVDSSRGRRLDSAGDINRGEVALAQQKAMRLTVGT